MNIRRTESLMNIMAPGPLIEPFSLLMPCEPMATPLTIATGPRLSMSGSSEAALNLRCVVSISVVKVVHTMGASGGEGGTHEK